ncbi:MAG: DUF560 domain-containing protein [Rhodobacteraceae bacterium]|nr:MAG: DUF560 domain-containing protein [Paracoccaceae bacterium]
MKLCLRRLFAGLTVALALATGATAQTPAETMAQALQRGDAVAAREALSRHLARRPDAGLHQAQLEGLIALRAGDADGAIAIFRDILAVAPDFEPARMWLIRALHAAGQLGAAVAQAHQLASRTEDAQLRDQLLTQLATVRHHPRAGLALRFALLPSSNITAGSATRTVMIDGVPFMLDPASRATSGLGVTLGATAWYRWTLGPMMTAIVSASLDHRRFSTSRKPDETELALRLDVTRRGPRSTLTFGPRVTQLFQAGDLTRQQAGFGTSAAGLVTARLQLFIHAEYLRQRFPRAEFRDGIQIRVTPGLHYALSQDTRLTLELPVLRETARAAHLTHTDLALGLGLSTRLGDELHLGVSTLLGRNTHDGVYPGFSVARRDRVRSLRVTLSHDRLQFQGLVPQLTLTRRWQSSNIPLHRMRATDVALSLSRRF